MSRTSEPRKSKTWHALDLTASSNAREAVEYALMEAGALGTETRDQENGSVNITGYFDRLPHIEEVRSQLLDAMRIYDLESSSVYEMNVREVPDEDWLGEWRKSWQPVEVGKRLIIAPPWAEIANDHSRIVIRIEPGMAFGTGTHETTRLCLSAIEKYFAGGSFLDVGTGTGILAIAAAKLFPDALIQACDNDSEAIDIARENARLNAVADRIVFRAGSIDETTPSADFVCANLTADVIAALMPHLVGATCGRLVLSGILDSQLERVLVRSRECGAPDPVEIMNDGEWSALVL